MTEPRIQKRDDIFGVFEVKTDRKKKVIFCIPIQKNEATKDPRDMPRHFRRSSCLSRHSRGPWAVAVCHARYSSSLTFLRGAASRGRPRDSI